MNRNGSRGNLPTVESRSGNDVLFREFVKHTQPACWLSYFLGSIQSSQPARLSQASHGSVQVVTGRSFTRRRP